MGLCLSIWCHYDVVGLWKVLHDINGRKMLVLKELFSRCQCLSLVSKFTYDILKHSAWADAYRSLKYELFLVHYFIFFTHFLFSLPGIRNFILGTRICAAQSSLQCSVIYLWNQRRKLQTILDTFSEFCTLNQKKTHPRFPFGWKNLRSYFTFSWAKGESVTVFSTVWLGL